MTKFSGEMWLNGIPEQPRKPVDVELIQGNPLDGGYLAVISFEGDEQARLTVGYEALMTREQLISTLVRDYGLTLSQETVKSLLAELDLIG